MTEASRDRDVTELVNHGSNDDECLPLTKCVCGAEFPVWSFFISIYRETPYHCPKCGRGLYFTCEIRIYEAVA